MLLVTQTSIIIKMTVAVSVSYKHCLPYNFRLNSLRNIVKSKNPLTFNV